MKIEQAMPLPNLFDLVIRQSTLRPENIAVVNGEDQLTYRKLHDDVLFLAAQLGALGIKSGDRVALWLNKGIEEILVLFAIARLEAIAIPVNYRWKAHQCNHALRDCAVKLVISDARKVPELLDFQEGAEFVSIVTVQGASVAKHYCENCSSDGKTVAVEKSAIPENLAVILYTSGSTGMPKGVMLTHDTLLQGAKTVAGYLNNSETDRILSLLPLSFDYGLSQLTTMFLVGGTLVLQKTSMVSSIVDNLQLYKITGMAGLPMIWMDIVSYLETARIQLTHLRYITNSGGKIPDNILKKMAGIFVGVDIYLMYGFTEAFRSTFLHPNKFHEKLGSMGKALPGVEVHVVHPERGLCAPNEVGELIHCGDLISSGYWGNPEATGKKIRPCKFLRQIIGDKPVACSGDYVRYDKDGFLWFVARMDEMIKSCGNRISPTEVEDIVYKSGLVRQAVAFGTEDGRQGQVVHLVITPFDPDFEQKTLQTYCREHMPSYMIPGKIYVWNDRMPVTGNGKIDRSFVIEKVWQVANAE